MTLCLKFPRLYKAFRHRFSININVLLRRFLGLSVFFGFFSAFLGGFRGFLDIFFFYKGIRPKIPFLNRLILYNIAQIVHRTLFFTDYFAL